jgi:hypothetical protein
MNSVITKKQVVRIMIVTGLVITVTSAFCLIFQSNQWVQSNSRWFVFGDGIIIFILGLVILLSKDKENRK